MNRLLATAILVALFLGKVCVSQKFALKKNQDGTYLLVPAGTNGYNAGVVDIKRLPPIPVDSSDKPESPGVNSQSAPAAAPSLVLSSAPTPTSAPASGPTAKTAPTIKPTAGTNQTSAKKPPQQPTAGTNQTSAKKPPQQNLMTLALKGKDGKAGSAGSKGPLGAQGPPGSRGEKGPRGDPGVCQPSPFQCSPGILANLTAKIAALEKSCKGGAKGQGSGVQTPPQCGLGRCEGNAAVSCQTLYKKDPSAQSGAYWIKGKKAAFQTHCEMIRKKKNDIRNPDTRGPPEGGWTLVGRIYGGASDFSPVSDKWASDELLNADTAGDITQKTSMKNEGWNSLKSGGLLLCLTSPNTGCAPFTHKRDMPLAELFKTQFGIVPEEQYSFATLLKAFDKSCDLSVLRQGWCGLNLANTCNPSKDDPNSKPVKTTHIVRIGCIGDKQATCFPDDYALGVGVSSCKDGFGCSAVGASKNMHYRCDYVHGIFMHTAFVYVF